MAMTVKMRRFLESALENPVTPPNIRADIEETLFRHRPPEEGGVPPVPPVHVSPEITFKMRLYATAPPHSKFSDTARRFLQNADRKVVRACLLDELSLLWTRTPPAPATMGYIRRLTELLSELERDRVGFRAGA